MSQQQLLNEKVMSLTQAAREHDVSVSTIWRWFQKGVDGTYLETCKKGGRRVTSLEAIARFHQRVNDNDRAVPRHVEVSSSRTREAAISAAEKELERAGI